MLGDFNHPDICWKSGTASCKQSRRLSECVKDNFLIQVRDKLTRGEKLLDLFLTNTDELIRKVMIDGSLGCNEHALVEFMIFSDMGQGKSRVKTLNFRRVEFSVVQGICGWDPLGNCPQG